MPLYLILPTFFIVWFITMFAVIPFGLKAPDKDNPNHYAGAPTGLKIKRKLVINTLLAIVITGLIHALFLTGWVELRDAY